jgi:hypothetical protein
MESREMYNATSHLTSLVTWDNDWIHFGTDNQIKFELIQKLIEEHLPDKEILLIHGRTTSGQFKKEEIRELIKPLLGKDDFQLWTTPMDKVIQFKRIGVLNVGIL